MMNEEKKQAYEGQCHCGRIKYSVTFLPDTVTICNCSICRRYNAVWGYFRRDQVKLDIADEAEAAYQWNDRMINFIHCRFCGSITHYEDIERMPKSRLAINFRMCPDDVWKDIRIRRFDGADTFREIIET